MQGENGKPGSQEHISRLTVKNCKKRQSRFGHRLSVFEESH